MHGFKPSQKSKQKKSPSPKNTKNNNNNNSKSNSTIIINEFDSLSQYPEEEILYQIYSNRLHPPPIGTFSKELNLENNLNLNTLSPVMIKDKKIILGEGSFSIVQLYEDDKTKIKYAVKKMNIETIEKISKNKNLINTEVNIHGRIDHPNIIKLHNYFNIKNISYLILEYSPNGTLFDIIRSSRGLSETYTFYYFLQTLNAIYFLHLHSIIHRDLKPENLLINEKNIIKLCDFGWSVKLKDNKRTTFCGTVEYMAPEIIKKQEYDETIDVWSLGVLLYELVHSYSPFFSEDLDMKKIGNNITNNNLKFKEGLSDDYKNLVQCLLIKDSTKRIKIENIFQHPFMTKYINMIYLEINSNKNTTIHNENNSEESNSTIKIPENIIKKRNEHINKNKNRKIEKINTEINKNNNSKFSKEDDIFRDTNTNAIFESIPNEPIPKILPEPKLYYNEIKKIKTNYYKKMPELNINQNNIKTNREQKDDMLNKKFNIENKIFKNQKIAHVKSFSLGQNDPTFKDLNENRLKIIISINNTQNQNYINKNKNRNKNEKLFAKHKKSLSNFIQDNYLGFDTNLNMMNKIEPLNPLQQSLNIDNKNNHIYTNSKKKIINNQNYFTENKNSKSNKKLFYHDLNNNYIKTDNANNGCQYISMINTNNTNNYSNIIINSHDTSHDSKKVLRNKKLKISNSNYKDLKYLCRINSDSRKCLFSNTNTYNNTKSLNGNNNNNAKKSKSKKIKKIYKNNNLFQSSIDNIHKNIKVSFIDKIINTNNNNNTSNNNNNKTEIKIEKNAITNLKKNFDSVKHHLNFNENIKNSNKKERNVKK